MRTDLYAFDIDGTLIRSFLREGEPAAAYDLVELLPGRLDVLERLCEGTRVRGVRFALVTNQGGVAMGYQTQPQVWAKLGRVAGELLPVLHTRPLSVHVAFGHPQARVEPWAEPRHVRRRKPSPVMLAEALLVHEVHPDAVVYVGDMESDRECAERAGVRYVDAEEFFA